MNREQAKMIMANGYGFDTVPNLHPQPKANYYSTNKETGAIVEHYLPADPYSLDHYLKKGFVLDKSLLIPQTVSDSGNESVEEGAIPAQKPPKRKSRKKKAKK